jgi:hypothetical protein
VPKQTPAKRALAKLTIPKQTEAKLTLAKLTVPKQTEAKLTLAKLTVPKQSVTKRAAPKKRIEKTKIVSINKKPRSKIVAKPQMNIDFNAISNVIASLNKDLNQLYSNQKKTLIAKN